MCEAAGEEGVRERERDGPGYMCISWRELWEGGTDGQSQEEGERNGL